MYFAIDVGTGKEVTATLAQRHRRYTCPVCRSPVGLRKGVYRDAHFAHASGAAQPECDLYHSTEGGYGLGLDVSAPVRLEPSLLQSLALLLHVQPPAGRTAARWGLEVLIPKAPSSRGTLTFDGGGDRYRVEVSCDKLYGGTQSYVVNPDAPSFRVSRVSHDVDRAFGLAVQSPVSGLEAGRSSVFVAASGSRKSLAAGLDWGAAYYFVQRTGAATTVPPQITETRLADLGNWSCLLVRLPQVADEALAAWLQHATGLTVQPARRQWGVALPAMHRMDALARLVLETGTNLILAMQPGEIGNGPAIVRARSGETEVAVAVAGGDWRFVKVSGFKSTEPPVLEAEGQTLPDLVVSPMVRTTPVAIMTLGNRMVTASSVEARSLLEQVRTGLIELSALVLPAGLVPRLLSRPPGQLEWDSHELPTAADAQHPTTAAVSEPGLTELARVLHDTSRDVLLDLGPFGKWWLEGRIPIVASSETLTPSSRSHARWVLAAAGRPAAAARSHSDDALAAATLSLNAPCWLIAHHRVAAVRVRKKWERR